MRRQHHQTTVSRFLFAALATCALLFASVASHAVLTAAEAVNVSGKQRMLSQRIAKAYLMVGSGVDTLDAQEQLDAAVALFEKNHQALLEYAPTQAINEGLAAVEQSWFPYREVVVMPADKRNALRVIQLSDKVLAASENVVNQIQVQSGKDAGRLVNMSGRQRMLSQRIAKLYVAMAWRVEDSTAEAEFNKAIVQFETGLGTLRAAKENTPAISAALGRVQSQWSFSKAGFQQYKQGRFVPTVISTTTETMLKQMNDITTQYEGVMQGAAGKAAAAR